MRRRPPLTLFSWSRYSPTVLGARPDAWLSSATVDGPAISSFIISANRSEVMRDFGPVLCGGGVTLTCAPSDASAPRCGR